MNKLQFLGLVIVLFLLVQEVFTQQGLTLTKNQMYEDFDALVEKINSISPNLPIKKDLWNYDAIKEMKKLRKRVDQIDSDLGFYILLQRVFNLAHDLHTSNWGVQTGWAETQEKNLRKIQSKFKLSLANTYIGGKYIVTEPFAVEKETIAIGTEITRINGEKVDNYLKKCLSCESYSYDLDRKNFYYTGFFRNLETIFADKINFTFKSPNGKIQQVTLPTDEFTKYLPEKFQRSDKTRVEYWENEKILYIRLTQMNPSYIPYLKTEIGKYKDKASEIERIIIDIRGNQGGQDKTWQAIYSEILPASFSYPIKIDGYQNAMLTKEKLESFGVLTADIVLKKDDNLLLKKYNFFTLTNSIETLEPSNTSIRFKGKVFVLAEDIYSSAGSAMAIPNSNPNDNFYSIGRKTGYFLGIGFSPQQFILPNTKLKYRIPPSIEVTNVKTLSDLMNDKIEIEVPYNIEEFKVRFDYQGDISSKEYLLKYDSFIKKALEF